MVAICRRFVLAAVLSQARTTCCLSIDASEASLTLIDSRTGMVAHTLFVEEATDTIVDGLVWTDGLNTTENEFLRYRTLMNGESVYEGYLSLPDDPLKLPTSINAGTMFAEKIGKTSVEVEFWIGENVYDSMEIEVQALKKWMASIPMMVILFVGFLAKFHVIYTLMVGLFVGGCMVTGSLIDGFKSIITTYIINVASDTQHVYIYIFSLCVAGLTAMIRRSGGVSAVAQRIRQSSNSTMAGQIIVAGTGIALFFDPYASIILIGELFSPFFKLVPVSLEKYVFLIHATGVPASSINPLSTWVGFSSSLIQSQLDLLAERHGDLTIPEDGWTVFVRSVKYQYYPIFFLLLVPMLIVSRRDFGPMLVSERGRWLSTIANQGPEWHLRETMSRPDDDTPRQSMNFWFPMILWCGAIWTAFALVSDPESEDSATNFLAALIYCTIGTAAATQILYMLQSKRDGQIGFSPYDHVKRLCIRKDDGEDSEQAGTVRKAESYRKQIVSDLSRGLSLRTNGDGQNADFILKNLEALSSEDGRAQAGRLNTLAPPMDWNECTSSSMHRTNGGLDEIDAAMQRCLRRSTTAQNEEKSAESLALKRKADPQLLVSLQDGAQSFFKGGATVIPTLMTLTLAWATTEVFLEIGVDRLFADLINRGNLSFETYPTMAFIISFLLALTTGSSATAQTIVLPLFAIPLYDGTDGNVDLFYGLLGAVFSGSVVGDHASPISTSTILSTCILECDLKNHIATQTPYIIFVAFLSLIVGHLPAAFERYPYYFGYGIGAFLLAFFVYFLCEDVLHKEGKYDFITERYLTIIINRRLQDQKTRMCIFHGIKMATATQDNDLLLDTDSASLASSSRHKDSSKAQPDSQVIEEIRKHQLQGKSVRSRSRSSSQRSRSPASGETNPRSRDQSPASQRKPSRQSQCAMHTTARPASIMRSKSPEARPRLSQRSPKGAVSATPPTDRLMGSGTRDLFVAASPRDCIEDTPSAVSRDLTHPPGFAQIASNGDKQAVTGGFPGYFVEDDAYVSPEDDGRDVDGTSQTPDMQSRVMKWLGRAIDDDDDADYARSQLVETEPRQ